jgi:hypothetical protein
MCTCDISDSFKHFRYHACYVLFLICIDLVYDKISDINFPSHVKAAEVSHQYKLYSYLCSVLTDADLK